MAQFERSKHYLERLTLLIRGFQMSEFGEHPVNEIKETRSSQLRGKTICMCLTGSVAIVQASSIARELIRHGADVIVAMTKAATELVHPILMEWATGNSVILELTGKVEHIQIAGAKLNYKGKADLVMVCLRLLYN